MKILAAIQNFPVHWTYCFSSKVSKNSWMPVQIFVPCTLYNVTFWPMVDNKMKKNLFFFILACGLYRMVSILPFTRLFYLVFFFFFFFFLFFWVLGCPYPNGVGALLEVFSLFV